MYPSIQKSICIQASASLVWRHLTEPALMKAWMGDAELEIEVITGWEVGGPILIKGFHHAKFENKGQVMQFEPDEFLRYSHLSSVSRLPDLPENYSIHSFRLKPENGQTLLSLRVENFPTETIYKHLEFYWAGTLSVIKNSIEAYPSG